MQRVKKKKNTETCISETITDLKASNCAYRLPEFKSFQRLFSSPIIV